MNVLPHILAFIFGTIVGSFLNVVSIRFRTGKSVGGRSKCMSCSKKLEWFELIPVFSFMAQKGACRKCKSKISWQYPIVEFLAGALFVLVFFAFPPVTLTAAITTLLQLLAVCLLVIVVVYDIKHKIIPDSLVLTFSIVALLGLFLGGETLWHVPSIESLIAGPLLAVPFALIWLVSRGKWMGLGDAKLTVGIGWILGINAGINALILAFWVGAIISVVWLFLTYKKFKRNTEIPFGPYLVIGMYLVLIFGVQVIDIALMRNILGSLL